MSSESAPTEAKKEINNMKNKRDLPPSWPINPNLPSHLFSGAAPYYAKYRVPYPMELVADLASRTHLEIKKGHLVDLACGTGEVLLAISRYFETITAVDLEPGMIEMGKARAAAKNINNIDWRCGLAEELILDTGSVNIVTMGASFHRVDRRKITHLARKWLMRDGFFVVLGSNSVWTGKEEWQKMVVSTISRYEDKHMSGGLYIPQASDLTKDAIPRMTHEEILIEAGFQVREYHFAVPHVWSADELVGYLYSTSKREALMAQQDAFECEIRDLLRGISDTDSYPETMDFYYILAAK